ncbi:MAG TPA: DNA adenine methylase, partial [Ktedonobacteraceae bacterium]
KWENSNNQDILERAQAEIRKSAGPNLPVFLDPFAGGGSLALEAQRLGLEAYASDLNPVAVLIEKALIEIPPKFANRPPVNPGKSQLFEEQKNDWKRAYGLADDIRYYGKWMRDEAEKRIGHLYPKVTLPPEQGGRQATVIAWLWVRTVTCPNPACGACMPLTSKWWLSKKQGKEVWAEPAIDRTVSPPAIHFTVKAGQGKPHEGTVNRQGARCVACGATVPFDHIRSEGKAGRMGAQLLSIVAEGSGRRAYLSPDSRHSALAAQALPISEVPATDLPEAALGFRVQNYGMTQHKDLFTSRQLVALTTFSDLVQEVRQQVFTDAQASGLPDDNLPLHAGGRGAQAYADAVATYLALVVDRSVDRNSAICSWDSSPKMEALRNTFARQAIPMVWDFAEGNPFSASSGNWINNVEWVSMVIDNLTSAVCGYAGQQDTMATVDGNTRSLISTDPPYYDNIGYADLSDFFYVWLRRSLREIYPDLFRTMLVPKKQELVATPYRFGGNKKLAQEFFEAGLGEAFARMRAAQHPDYPLTVYYAFKQAESEVEQESASDEDEDESKDNGKKRKMAVASTGWETMLEGLIRSGFEITGTWPMRTEMMNRSVGQGTNALASSIVLVCRPRPANAPVATRGDFLRALRRELPEALRKLQHGSIAPVDLAQASIGPGMSIYSRYSQVVESDGSPLRVRTALQIINQELDAALAEQEGGYDSRTRWAVAWFEQFGLQETEYGVAETLSKAKNVSVGHLEQGGLVEARAGRVRLRRREELNGTWNAGESNVWEITQRMIHAIQAGKGELGGEVGAANILCQVPFLSESVRELAYRLYTVCERRGWAQEALAYNSLITSWTQISNLAHRSASGIEQKSWL